MSGANNCIGQIEGATDLLLLSLQLLQALLLILLQAGSLLACHVACIIDPLCSGSLHLYFPHLSYLNDTTDILADLTTCGALQLL
jgi:hypothetical protein